MLQSVVANKFDVEFGDIGREIVGVVGFPI